MKKFTLLFLLSAILFTIGCNNDDDTSLDATLNGRWLLKNYSGGFAGDSYDFTTIVWEINAANNTVKVYNINNGAETHILQNGIYDYSIINDVLFPGMPDACTENFKVGDKNFGCMLFSDQNRTLTLTHKLADGYSIRFERMPNE